MRTKFIAKYEMDRDAQEKTNHGQPLLPSDYHRIQEETYNIEFDDNNIVIYHNTQKFNGYNHKNAHGCIQTKVPVIRKYLIDSFFAGGAFIIFADRTAELVQYGSGLPVLNSTVGIIH
jgi:hypothetical protein